MTEIADDRSWWADVEHLRPDGEGPRRAASPPTSARSRATAVAERPDTPRREDRGRQEGVAGESSSPRRLRITRDHADDVGHARSRRPDVAAFADALDLDGAFGAPVNASRSREIILTGGPRTDADDHAGAAGLPADRRTVHIRGTAGLHEIAERRPLREIGERRPRDVMERAVVRPDRIAMYVVLLGAFLVFLAVAGQSAGS